MGKHLYTTDSRGRMIATRGASLVADGDRLRLDAILPMPASLACSVLPGMSGSPTLLHMITNVFRTYSYHLFTS
jgi:hypothetical protein